MSNKPKLSILCITYNHKNFIRQALDGFIMQKTNFPFEVLIHDDASTDGTADIIREYEKKYPDIIKPIYQKENQYSKGVPFSKQFQWPRIQGKYVAMCEGDDYWTDTNKLQKQVDFLDEHPKYSTCFHSVRITYEDHSEPDSIFPKVKKWKHRQTTGLTNLLKRNYIPANSIVFRWRLKGKEDLFPDHITPGDWYMNLLHAQVGKIGYLPEVMSVYRRHSGGIWWNAGKNDLFFIQHGVGCMNWYIAAEKQFGKAWTTEKNELMQNTIQACLIYKNWDLLKKMSKIFPDLYQNALKQKGNIQTENKYRKKYKKYRFLTYVLLGLSIILLMLNI